MPGIESFIKKKTEFKENYEGLKTNPQLIAVDGPDGVGKTTLCEKLTQLLKEKFKTEGKNPDDVIYIKYTKFLDTESQRNITKEINRKNDASNGDNNFEPIYKLWCAKLNRSYHDIIVPFLKEGKTLVVDRSEIDVIRGAIEWGHPEMLKSILQQLQNGTLTDGVVSGNRIFISGNPDEIWDNLNERGESLTHNDPKSLEGVVQRIKAEKEAEETLKSIKTTGHTNYITIDNPKVSKENIDANTDTLCKSIIEKLEN